MIDIIALILYTYTYKI
ncbi:hypothetical protein, partial [Plasmodium yoelii yoelii]